MKDYHDLYANSDILLLVDVFEKFRNSSLRNSELCSSDYVIPPGFNWHAILIITNVWLKFFLDPEVYTYFVKGRGGEVSYISNGYSKVIKTSVKKYIFRHK